MKEFLVDFIGGTIVVSILGGFYFLQNVAFEPFRLSNFILYFVFCYLVGFWMVRVGVKNKRVKH
ncbi:hypothetical protein ABNX05_11325 [Lysinibacillus sp. M3]|uniref:Uncharacterized protein n=1 Tax=Lysinibacillus zambalensis TaxID=3160866 RepID=A0ABV1MTI1_9BACI